MKTLPESQMPSYSGFKNWENRMYLPGEMCPSVYIETFDNKHPEIDAFCGVRRVSAMFRRIHRNTNGVGYRTNVSTIVKQRPGVYFVIACRGTLYQPNTKLMNILQRTGGSPSAAPATNIVGAANTIRRREAQLARPLMLRRRVQKRPARVIKKIHAKK
jgi:hypothetical protein